MDSDNDETRDFGDSPEVGASRISQSSSSSSSPPPASQPPSFPNPSPSSSESRGARHAPLVHPGLETICPDVIKHMLQYMDGRSKKMLRGVSCTMRDRVEGLDKTVYYWKFKTKFTTERLLQFSDAIPQVLGIVMEDAADDGVRYLVRKHPEIELFQIGESYDMYKYCQFSHFGLSYVLSLPNLVSVEIKHSIEPAQLPVYNVKSSKLRTLGVCNFNVAESELVSLLDGCLAGLQHLFLPGNIHVTDNLLCQLLDYPAVKLKSLYLGKSKITGEILSDLQSSVPCMEYLNIMHSKLITGKGLYELVRLCGRNLKVFDISGCYVNDTKLFSGPMPCIDYLECNFNTGLTDTGLMQIFRVYGRTLRILDFSWTNITGAGLKDLKVSLPCLQNLVIQSCGLFGDPGLRQIVRLCGSTLRNLDVLGSKVSCENLGLRPGCLPYLENLNLFACHRLTDNGLVQVLELCGGTLKSLHINNTKVTGEKLDQYDESLLPRLEIINCSWSKSMSDSGLLQILRLSGTTLKSLDIGLTSIRGDRMSEYRGTLPSLEKLKCAKNTVLTDSGLLDILRLCRPGTLTNLDIQSTKISVSCMERIQGEWGESLSIRT